MTWCMQQTEATHDGFGFFPSVLHHAAIIGLHVYRSVCGRYRAAERLKRSNTFHIASHNTALRSEHHTVAIAALQRQHAKLSDTARHRRDAFKAAQKLRHGTPSPRSI